jgi:thiamine-monophosphate kinase
LALTLPEADEVWLEAFSRSLAQQAVHYGVSLVGGDTTRGPLCLSIQVHGLVPVGCALRRDGAAAGDLIYVSGHLGDAAAGLDQIQNRAEPNPYLTARFYRPEPRFDVAELLLGFASAAIDVSDGLLADLGHILTRSGVGAELDPARLPLSESILNLYSAEQARRWALSGGEDFELCFTVPVSRVDKLEQALAERSILCTRVGMITSGSGVKLLQSDGRLLAVAADGYRHFK